MKSESLSLAIAFACSSIACFLLGAVSVGLYSKVMQISVDGKMLVISVEDNSDFLDLVTVKTGSGPADRGDFHGSFMSFKSYNITEGWYRVVVANGWICYAERMYD